jgi:four helix bundle protein
MALEFEELRVLQQAEEVADGVWKQVSGWEVFARDTVGKQLVRAVDSIGANVAEAYGRFHYGEKLQFLYYARGSLFETKYWLNRARERTLMSSSGVQEQTTRLTDLARQLNSFAAMIKSQRHPGRSQAKGVREAEPEYAAQPKEAEDPFLTDQGLHWLESAPISNT